ncbi:MAG TPA: glycoside hydrolase family 27 protein [Terriglobales bacterium]|nr:glycoside hydrolase family 27 protein [Terriglobales bacterium]
MSNVARVLLTLILFSAMASSQVSGPTGQASTPPMGWNSWDSFAQNIDEATLRKTAEKVAEDLKRFGWNYIVIDEGWYITNPTEDASKYRFAMTADGRFLPDPARFPSSANNAGFKPLADYIHSLGLRFGIHILRGIPRQAVQSGLQIADSKFHARDAADESDTCPWNSYNFGVRDNPAGQAYYDSILKLYASWGVDFIKVDCIADHPYKPAEIRMISEAIRNSGRPIVLCLSPGPTALEHASEVAKYAEMWRTCNDFWDHWGTWKDHEWSQGLLAQFQTAADWAPHITPGHWPDSDMLPLGRLGPSPGAGKPRNTLLTRDEQRTMMTLWSIARSPLMMGGNLLELDDWTRSLLTNDEIITADQHSKGNRQALRDGDLVVWTAQPEKGNAYYVGVFNIGDTELNVDRSWHDVGLEEKFYRIRDLWQKKNVGTAKRLKVKLAPHASVMWSVR